MHSIIDPLATARCRYYSLNWTVGMTHMGEETRWDWGKKPDEIGSSHPDRSANLPFANHLSRQVTMDLSVWPDCKIKLKCLAIYSNKNLPNSLPFLQKSVQKKSKYKVKSRKLTQTFKNLPNLVTLGPMQLAHVTVSAQHSPTIK